MCDWLCVLYKKRNQQKIPFLTGYSSFIGLLLIWNDILLILLLYFVDLDQKMVRTPAKMLENMGRYNSSTTLDVNDLETLKDSGYIGYRSAELGG